MHLTATLRLLPRKLPRHHLKPLLNVRTSVSLAEESRKLPVKQSVKGFHEIPGPKSIPLFGTTYLYIFGVYSAKRHRAALKKYLKFGPIIKEEIEPGNFVVWIFDHNDMEHLYLSENEILEQSHLAMGVFREDRPHVYNSRGLLSTNGEDWWNLRREFQKGFRAPEVIQAYLPATDYMIQDFVESRLIQKRDDFLPEFLRLSLRLTSLVAFDKDIDCFSSKEMRDDSLSSCLMEAVLTSNKLGFFLDKIPEPKTAFTWKKFEKAVLHMEDVAVKMVKKKALSLDNKKTEKPAGTVPSLLEMYLTSHNLNYKDVVGMSIDLLLCGIEATASTASFALYHLAQNERVQNLLRLESQKILTSPRDPISVQTLANAPYSQAVLKEVLRMNPLHVGVSRSATQDIVLSGYHIPKGTTIVTQNQIACRLKKYFVLPNEFLPERWIKGSPVEAKDNPFLVLPFGYGPRSCIARHLAEQQLLTFLLRIVYNHRISWNSKTKLDCKNLTSTINKPDQELKFSFSVLH